MVSRRTHRAPVSGALTQVRVLSSLEDIDLLVGCYPDVPDQVVSALDDLWQALSAWRPPDRIQLTPVTSR